MSKEFTEVAFDLIRFKTELDQFGKLLKSKKVLGERELQKFFKAAPHLTAYIGTTFGRVGIARHIAYEFQILGDYSADIVVGNPEKQFCLVELESGSADAILARAGKKATKEWSRSFDRGFSQIVDWFCHIDDFKKTDRFHKNFGHGHIDFTGLMLIGRNDGLDADDIRRIRWRAHNVIVDSHSVMCMTYDDLFQAMTEGYNRYLSAFNIDPSTVRHAPPAPAKPPPGPDRSP